MQNSENSCGKDIPRDVILFYKKTITESFRSVLVDLIYIHFSYRYNICNDF